MVDESAVAAMARKYALQNAVQHGGKANPGAVVGKIMGEAPELRGEAKTVMPIIQRVAGEVNGLDPEDQKAELESLEPALLEKKKRERGHPFKTLPRYEEFDDVVMRFAPNPNGPATLGHSRGMVTMAEYRHIAHKDGKKGTLILRYDDTDPQVKPPFPPAYDWILEDYGWLGETPDRTVRASDRIEEYYKVAVKLIERGAAYICFCAQADAKEFRDAGRPCPHRDIEPSAHLAAWGDMLAGAYEEGHATLRIKTQVDHKDPALRDWVAFRVAKTPHPMVGDRFKVWPMLDFESAVEDHLQGVTHIIRGKDLMDSTHRQRFLYEHMEWRYPETLYWGRVRLDEVGKFSSSGMRRDIDAGKYSGWDDPRLPTLRAFRRRGFRPEAIRRFWVNMGLSEKDVAASLVNLYAENAKILEPEVDRYFFVPDPVEVRLQVPADAPEAEAGGLVAETARHPDHPERGLRINRVAIENGEAVLLMPREDLDACKPGDLVRLKDLGNVRVESLGEAPVVAWAGDDLAAARTARAPVVQWLPAGAEVVLPLEMLRPEPSDDPQGLRVRGFVERNVLESAADDIVQFERYGYARLQHVAEDGVVAVFAHR